MVDLLMGGSPCQGFSSAGKRLNFSDPRSALFFNYVEALKILKPKYFLLENVKMKKECQDIISTYLGVEPIEINSALVSAQNRVRLYWTNIPDLTLPKDKGLLLKDIIEDGYLDQEKSYCLDSSYCNGGSLKVYFERYRRQLVFTQNFGETSQSLDRALQRTKGLMEKARCMTASARNMTSSGATNVIHNRIFRLLSPLECERLQTLPDNYTEGISRTQRYKCIGNAWTVDVIAHILSHIPEIELDSVVGLFDGISCGQVALKRACKKYRRYYASEIDRFAIQITHNNFPDTQQIGDITKIDWQNLAQELA